jgi:hypothetical protein
VPIAICGNNDLGSGLTFKGIVIAVRAWLQMLQLKEAKTGEELLMEFYIFILRLHFLKNINGKLF